MTAHEHIEFFNEISGDHCTFCGLPMVNGDIMKTDIAKGVPGFHPSVMRKEIKVWRVGKDDTAYIATLHDGKGSGQSRHGATAEIALEKLKAAYNCEGVPVEMEESEPVYVGHYQDGDIEF